MMADEIKTKSQDDLEAVEWEEPRRPGKGKGWFGDSRRHAACGGMGGRARKRKSTNA